MAIAFGLLAAAYGLDYAHREVLAGALRPDFDHLWFASRALWQGRDPYPLVGPGKAFDWPFGLNYPPPALLLLGPIVWLPLDTARFVFVGLGVACFTFAVTRDSWSRLPLVASAAMLHAVTRAQWSPLLAAAWGLPALRALYVAKPTIGAALWIGRPSRIALVSGILLCLVSFALVPAWPVEWLHATRTTPFGVPLLTTGGFVLLAALPWWRRDDARLLLSLACVPQTTVLYESVYITAIAESKREVLAICLATYVARFLETPGLSYAAHIHQAGRLVLWCVYVPVLIVVLYRGWTSRSATADSVQTSADSSAGTQQNR